MYKTNSDLPAHVVGVLPILAQNTFRAEANMALEGGAGITTAIRKAWVAVKQDWERGPDKWVRKVESPNPISALRKGAPRPLYVARYVQNAKEVIDWAKEQGFAKTVQPGDLHVTIAHSRAPLDWMKVPDEGWVGGNDGNATVTPGGPRAVEPLGDKGAVVLMFKSSLLEYRWKQFKEAGATWDFDGYQPHVTISYDGSDVDISKIKPYTGKIVLGPEIFTPIDDNWVDNITEKRLAYRGLLAAAIIQKFNPHHDKEDGKFTSGPGGSSSGSSKSGGSKALGGSKVPGSQAAGGVNNAKGRAGEAAQKTKDWFKTNVGPKAEAAKKQLADPETQKSIAASAAKIVGKAMLEHGVSIALVAAVGTTMPFLLPLLNPVVKSIAVAGIAMVVEHIARKTGESMPEVLDALEKGVASKASSLNKATTLTEQDLIAHQLAEFKELLREVDPSEDAAAAARAQLEEEDPAFLEELLAGLEQVKSEYEEDDEEDPEADKEEDDDNVRVVKVDQSLGLVIGWAIVCKKDGKDYYDLNVDHATGERVPEHITESAMLKASADFMENSRVHKEMHDGDARGTTVFAFPMTTDIAKAMGIETSTTGLLVAMKPDAKMLAKYVSGELTGFSIGGSRIKSVEENT